MIFGLNGGFAKRKRMIYALMRDLRRENAGFSLKWGICKEKTRDFRVKCGIGLEKTRDFRINGGFEKRKRVIFAYMGDLRRENA